MGLSEYIDKFFVSPTLLRVVRVFRVGRVLRLVKSAKGIRTLLFSLAVSLPALFNIGLLLFLVMFIYAIFGMSFFMHVKHTEGVDDLFNFETFGRSMIVLFQISTTAGWNSILAGLMNDSPPGCDPHLTKDYGDCGNTTMAIVFLITYLIVSSIVVINMYIAVILENFSQATEDVQQGLTQDDFDMYYEVWEGYDPEASEFIPLDKVYEFCDVLEEPLRLPAPNFGLVVYMDIPICQDDLLHCVDILDALTKNFLGTTGEADVEAVPKKDRGPKYVIVSSTFKRVREKFAARKIQRYYRAYRERRGPLGENPELPEKDDTVTEQPLASKDSIIHIEDVEEKDKDTEKDASRDNEKEEKNEKNTKQQENEGDGTSKDDGHHDGSDDENPPPTGPLNVDSGDSKTVELYPESGVVA